MTCCWRAQRLADGLGVHVRVAVHVAADPGAEAQDLRQLERARLHAVHLLERRCDLLVEGRQDPVQDLADEEQHVLALVGDREPLARVLRRLPAAVISLRIRSQIWRVSGGVSDGSSRSSSSCAMLCCLRSIVRRVDSVGCAVNTGSIQISIMRRRTSSSAETLRLAAASRASTMPPGCVCAFDEILAAAADAMHLFRHVDHFEPHRERAHQVARLCGRNVARAARELAGAFGAPSRRAIAAWRSCSTGSNSASPPCSRSTSPTSAPSTCTSSRSSASFSGKEMSERGMGVSESARESNRTIAKMETAARRGLHVPHRSDCRFSRRHGARDPAVPAAARSARSSATSPRAW